LLMVLTGRMVFDALRAHKEILPQWRIFVDGPHREDGIRSPPRSQRLSFTRVFSFLALRFLTGNFKTLATNFTNSRGLF
jgi:hypothetical protein